MGRFKDLLLQHELNPRVVHKLPGRLRLHVPALKRLAPLNGDVTPLIEDFLSLPGGVDTVSVNTRSGSVLIQYQTGDISEAQVLERIQFLGTRVRQQWSQLEDLDPVEDLDTIRSCLQALGREE